MSETNNLLGGYSIISARINEKCGIADLTLPDITARYTAARGKVCLAQSYGKSLLWFCALDKCAPTP